MDYSPSYIGAVPLGNRFVSINRQNFYTRTVANFLSCDKPNRKPDYKSSSGSFYWYIEGGIIRMSDHWGFDISSCHWTIDQKRSRETFCGFCKFEDFMYLHWRDAFNIEKIKHYLGFVEL